MKAYPMTIVLAVMIAVLLSLDYFKPAFLLRPSAYALTDSLRTYRFVLSSEARESPGRLRYETEEGVLLYLSRDSVLVRPQSGDTVIARTRIRRGAKTPRFDYGLYLRRQGKTGVAYVYKYRLLKAATPPRPSLQRRLYHRLSASGLRGDALATTGALTLGYKEDLDPHLRHRFQSSSAAHVLAVSGLHTGIIYALLTALLSLGGRYKPSHADRIGRSIRSILVISVMWGYAWLTGLTPSVVRCVVMISLVEAGKIFYRHSPPLNTIAAAAVLILLVRPLDLWSISFQLSFAATAAIVVFAKDIPIDPSGQVRRNAIHYKLFHWAGGLALVSIAAQLGTLPITMLVFGQISNYFLLTNMIVLPLASLLVPFGLLSVALGGSLPGQAIGWITSQLANLMNQSVGWIEGLPGSSTAVEISLPMALLLYAAMLMGWLSLHPRDPNHPSRALWWLTGVAAATGLFCYLYAGSPLYEG